jgi:hypothetical protein
MMRLPLRFAAFVVESSRSYEPLPYTNALGANAQVRWSWLHRMG